MEIEPTLKDIRRLLTENIDQKTVESEKRYFKEEIKTYGVSVYNVSKLGKQLLEKIKNNPKTEIFSLCEELWKSGFMEEAFLACDFAYSQRKSFEKKAVMPRTALRYAIEKMPGDMKKEAMKR